MEKEREIEFNKCANWFDRQIERAMRGERDSHRLCYVFSTDSAATSLGASTLVCHLTVSSALSVSLSLSLSKPVRDLSRCLFSYLMHSASLLLRRFPSTSSRWFSPFSLPSASPLHFSSCIVFPPLQVADSPSFFTTLCFTSASLLLRRFPSTSSRWFSPFSLPSASPLHLSFCVVFPPLQVADSLLFHYPLLHLCISPPASFSLHFKSLILSFFTTLCFTTASLLLRRFPSTSSRWFSPFSLPSASPLHLSFCVVFPPLQVADSLLFHYPLLHLCISPPVSFSLHFQLLILSFFTTLCFTSASLLLRRFPSTSSRWFSLLFHYPLLHLFISPPASFSLHFQSLILSFFTTLCFTSASFSLSCLESIVSPTIP